MGLPGRGTGGRRLRVPAAAGGAALSSDAVFELRDVSKTYTAGGAEFQLRIPHLDVRPGARLAFVGESGSGKSTLLELLAMILRPSQCGRFRFKPAPGGQAHDIGACWQQGRADALSDLRCRHIGYVLQSGGLLPYLSVRENVNLSRRLLHLPLEDAARRLAGKLDIAEQLDKLPAKLSMGQRQRAAIARAIAHEPSILIADEPTAALDPVNAERIARLLADLADELGVTLIMATHVQALVDRLGLSRVMHRVEAPRENAMTVTVTSDD